MGHHPKYGTYDWHRLIILAYASTYGIMAACHRYNVCRTSIRNWRLRLKEQTERQYHV